MARNLTCARTPRTSGLFPCLNMLSLAFNYIATEEALMPVSYLMKVPVEYKIALTIRLAKSNRLESC